MCRMFFRGRLAAFGATASLLLLSGCAAPPPKPQLQASTKFHVFIPTGATGYRPQPNQFIVIGPPVVQAPPVYPAALIAERLPPERVCLAVDIDEHGKAYHSDPLYAVDGCPAPGVAPIPFVESAQAAVGHWQFFPTHPCTFPKGVDVSKEGNDCIAEGAKVQNLAIKLAFAFTFSVEAGAPQVTTHRVQPGPSDPAPARGRP